MKIIRNYPAVETHMNCIECYQNKLLTIKCTGDDKIVSFGWLMTI